ncbi:MAG: class I SAM-dependent methyltransferase [Pedobacter sp.]|nr:MAG: class I SAM-dependent methyltransferase [Pedobacter sp.]
MDFLTLKKRYQNSEAFNDHLHKVFTEKTAENEWLSMHRKHVEENNLGYGDSAFHYMWLVILTFLQNAQPTKTITIMEIGVFKGQVISLWSLIKNKIGLQANIHAVSPFRGNPQPRNKLLYRLMLNFSKKFRSFHASANFYENEDYMAIVKNHFATHQLDFNNIILHKGFSTDPSILQTLNKEKFDLIYIDGDHTFEGVMADIKNLSPLIASGGIMVMDDASNNIPGSTFWKGHQQVSDACEIIPDLGFINVFNIGHNRVYQKI